MLGRIRRRAQLLSLASLVACGSAGGTAAGEDECKIGTEGCPCTSGLACDFPLVCVDMTCVAPSDGDSGGSTSTEGPSATGTSEDGGGSGAESTSTTGEVGSGDTSATGTGSGSAGSSSSSTGDTSSDTSTGASSDASSESGTATTSSTQGTSTGGVDGPLEFIAHYTAGGDGLDLEGAFQVVISADGAHLYVAAAIADLVVVFSRDQSSGELTYVQTLAMGGGSAFDSVRSVAVSPDGGSVYIVSNVQDRITVFDRNPATGALSHVEHITDGESGADYLDQAYYVVVAPGSGQVYVAALYDDAVSVFQRDVGTGALTFTQAVVDGVAGVSGLNWANGLAFDSMGAHLYVAASGSADAVTAFSRSPTDGSLTFVASYPDGGSGGVNLADATDVAVSSDGNNVYACAQDSDALTVFDRDPSTGALTFVESFVHGMGADGLDAPRRVTVAPDDANVYVASQNSDSVAIFDRSPGSGALVYVDAVVDGVDGVMGIDSATSVVVSPDDAHVYVTGQQSDTIAAFRRR